MTFTPTLEVFRNERDGSYSLLNYAINPHNKFTVGWGDLLHVSEAAMKSKGLELVLTNLAQFFSRDGSQKCELDRMPPAGRRRFLSTHKSIGISLPEPNRLALQGSTKHSSTGSVGTPEQRIEKQLPLTQEDFYSALLQVFEITQ